MNQNALELEKIKANILVVEDHQPVRQSILDWLDINFPQCVFSQAASGEEAVRVAVEKKPDMVLMDIELPGMNGLEATRQIKMDRPETKVLILTIHEGTQYQKEAAKVGANGYLSKREMYQELIPSMIKLFSGNETFFSWNLPQQKGPEGTNNYEN